MAYFNISIDDDIHYLLTEIGYNIHINNIPAKAIINNAGNIDYDDKTIITHEELQRGYYVRHDNLIFIVISEVNAKRYNTYYKATMRRCNYDVKFIIDNKLYLYYAIIESKNFTLEQGQYFMTSGDKITITLPLTDITKQIKVNDRVIKFNTAWEIEGIDYTKKGLVILHCKRNQINSKTDDVENEIADRYVSGTDRLNGNITPTLPFDEEPEPETKALDIIHVSTLDDIEVYQGTLIEDIELPASVLVTLEDSSIVELNVNWDVSTYNGDVLGTYQLVGTLELIEGISNTNNLTATINIIVKEIPQEDNYTIEIEGADTMAFMSVETFVAKIYNNGVEVTDKSVIWEIDKRFKVIETTDTTCTIEVPTGDYSTGKFPIKAILSDDENVFAVKEIMVVVF